MLLCWGIEDTFFSYSVIKPMIQVLSLFFYFAKYMFYFLLKNDNDMSENYLSQLNKPNDIPFDQTQKNINNSRLKIL